MKFLQTFESYDAYDIQTHLNLFKKLWDEKSGANRWYNKEPHFTIENIYDTDFKGIFLSTDSSLLNMWNRNDDNFERKDGVNKEFLYWLQKNGYTYHWHGSGSWDGILIIPPDYYEFLDTTKKYNL